MIKNFQSCVWQNISEYFPQYDLLVYTMDVKGHFHTSIFVKHPPKFWACELGKYPRNQFILYSQVKTYVKYFRICKKYILAHAPKYLNINTMQTPGHSQGFKGWGSRSHGSCSFHETKPCTCSICIIVIQESKLMMYCCLSVASLLNSAAIKLWMLIIKGLYNENACF